MKYRITKLTFKHFFGHTHGMQKFQGQGLNLNPSSEERHGSDNTGSLSQWATREHLKFFSFVLFFPFKAAPTAYGSSRLGVESVLQLRPTPQPQQQGTQALSAAYTTAHGNTRYLTHWARPRIEPASSWILVGFISTVP